MFVELFQCACFRVEHISRFIFDDENKCLCVEVQLNPYLNFFERVYEAFKYVFGFDKDNCHWESIVVDEEDCVRLKNTLERWLVELEEIKDIEE